MRASRGLRFKNGPVSYTLARTRFHVTENGMSVVRHQNENDLVFWVSRFLRKTVGTIIFIYVNSSFLVKVCDLF